MKCTVVVRGDFDLLFTMRKTRGSALLMLKNLRLTRLRTLSYLPSEEIVTQDVEYRYGFNGQERDDEIAGQGNSYTAEFWQYDSRLGRRWNQYPKPNPSISSYATFANNPILFSDHLGDTVKFEHGSQEAEDYNNFRDKVFGDDKNKDIQQEILAMEKSTTNFRLRTGDNITSEGSGGNTRYNKETVEIDLNYKASGDFSIEQKLAHELKHGFQFLEGKIGFNREGGGPDGILNDYQDEYEAYQRQNRFADPGGRGYRSNEQIHKIIRGYGYDYRTNNISLKTISSEKLNDMIRVNRLYDQHFGNPKFIYIDYESDL